MNKAQQEVINNVGRLGLKKLEIQKSILDAFEDEKKKLKILKLDDGTYSTSDGEANVTLKTSNRKDTSETAMKTIAKLFPKVLEDLVSMALDTKKIEQVCTPGTDTYNKKFADWFEENGSTASQSASVTEAK